jgi:hypothetical protein
MNEIDMPEDRPMELARQALAEIMDYQRRHLATAAGLTELQALTIASAIRRYHIEKTDRYIAKIKALL